MRKRSKVRLAIMPRHEDPPSGQAENSSSELFLRGKKSKKNVDLFNRILIWFSHA
jgi:hypothetical protein